MNLIVRSPILKKLTPSTTIHILYKVKIAHAAWLRDRTWPVGMEVPDSDERPNDERHCNALTIQLTPSAMTNFSETNDTTAL